MTDRGPHLLFRATYAARGTDAVPDADLVRRVARDGDRAAFELLLWRHGPAVWGVCRRILGPTPDAEDVFQIVFLTLSRRAGAIVAGTAVAGWLYRVAVRTALEAARSRTRRAGRETATADLTDVTGVDDPVRTAAGREVGRILDAEIARLPDRYRLPFLLCEVYGRDRTEVAAELGCAAGTVASRVSRAKARLRARLRGRDLAGLSAVAVPTGLSAAAQRVAFAPTNPLPERLVATAMKATGGFAGTLKAMTVVVGVAIVTVGLFAQPPKAPPEQPPVAPKAEAASAPVALPDGAVARLGSSLWRGLVDRFGSAHFEFTADGKFIVFLSPERTIVWLDAETGRVTKRVRGPAPFMNFSLAPDAKTLLTADEPKPVTMLLAPPGPPDPRCLRAWDVVGEPKQTWFLENELGRLAGDARHVAVFGDHKLSLLDVRTGQAVWSNPLDDEARSTLTRALSADGKSVIAVAGGDKVHPVFAWDVATGERRAVADMTAAHAEFTLSADGATAVAFGHEKVVRRWDLRSGKEMPALVGHTDGAVHAATVSRDGRVVVSSGIDRTIRWWDSATGKELGRIQTVGVAGHLQMSPDGKTLAAICSGETVFRRFDLTTKREVPTPDGHAAEITFLAFTADGKSLVTAADDNAVTIWDPATGNARRRFPARTFDQFRTAAMSPDGRLLANANGLNDDPVRLWDLSTGKAVRELAVAKGAVEALAFAPDGKALGVFRSRVEPPEPSLRLWDLAGKELWRTDTTGLAAFPGQAASWLQFTADGKRLWAATYPRPCAWDAATGRLVARAEEPLSTITPSPDGRMIAGWGRSNSGGTEIRLIETASGQVRSRFGALRRPADGPRDAAEPLVFSPDGRRVAAADRTAVVLWDVGTGKVARRFEGHDRDVRTLAFSPDGKILASGSEDSTIVLWDVSFRPPPPPPKP